MQARFLAALPLCLCLVLGARAQPTAHEARQWLQNEFGAQYAQALGFWQAHEVEMQQALAAQGLPVPVLLAAAFPELMRYHALADALETAALAMLYVNFGSDYADFSIGYFQMKPSFAEWLEAHGPPPAHWPRPHEAPAQRAARVERLQQLSGQLEYLALFYRVLMRLHPHWAQLPAVEQVRLLATAYNAGPQHSETALRQLMQQKHFHLGTWAKAEAVRYPYAHIALCFYQSRAEGLATK